MSIPDYALWVALAVPAVFLAAAGASLLLAWRIGRWPRR